MYVIWSELLSDPYGLFLVTAAIFFDRSKISTSDQCRIIPQGIFIPNLVPSNVKGDELREIVNDDGRRRRSHDAFHFRICNYSVKSHMNIFWGCFRKQISRGYGIINFSVKNVWKDIDTLNIKVVPLMLLPKLRLIEDYRVVTVTANRWGWEVVIIYLSLLQIPRSNLLLCHWDSREFDLCICCHSKINSTL